jgi:hypothetical protein
MLPQAQATTSNVALPYTEAVPFNAPVEISVNVPLDVAHSCIFTVTFAIVVAAAVEPFSVPRHNTAITS